MASWETWLILPLERKLFNWWKMFFKTQLSQVSGNCPMAIQSIEKYLHEKIYKTSYEPQESVAFERWPAPSPRLLSSILRNSTLGKWPRWWDLLLPQLRFHFSRSRSLVSLILPGPSAEVLFQQACPRELEPPSLTLPLLIEQELYPRYCRLRIRGLQSPHPSSLIEQRIHLGKGKWEDCWIASLSPVPTQSRAVSFQEKQAAIPVLSSGAAAQTFCPGGEAGWKGECALQHCPK